MKPIYKIALFVVFFMALVGILTGLYLFNLQHKDLKKVKPDFVITAVDLQKAFESNETSANSRFVKKILDVSGTIESVKPGEDKSKNVALKTGSLLGSVICTFQSDSGVSDLKVGDSIVIRGECSGYLTDVLLNNCSVIEKK
jgi:hypothetical protein